MDELKLSSLAEEYMRLCRPGDWEHAKRVVTWTKEIGMGRSDLDNLVFAAYIHDIGWYKLLPFTQKLTKEELKHLEPQANDQTNKMLNEFINKFADPSIEFLTISRLVNAADKHLSTRDDEAIIVDADNLSKLNIDHLKEKYQPEEWIKMYELWLSTFGERIRTTKGKELYPELLEHLKKQIEPNL